MPPSLHIPPTVALHVPFVWSDRLQRYATLALLALTWHAAPCVAQEQLPNLNVTPTADRFPMTGRVWPSTPGQAHLCLWEDDKLCAFTISVDDNIAPQVPLWFERAARVGFPVTWFVITDRIGGSNASFNGTWALWADVLAKGHDVQSHTRQHLHVEEPTWPGIEAEYAGSKSAIETNLPGHRCEFLAFPGGANTGYNDRNIAAQYYAGNRGGTGSGLNRPARIDYLAIKSGGFNLGTGSAFADLLSLFNASDLRYYRGWAAPLFHQVNDWASVEHYFDFVRTYRPDIWAARFTDVGKYGQERDTATLVVSQSTATQIAFSLSDRMLDSRFDYPLTIKIRLPNTWQSVVATQDGIAVPSRFVRHAGSPFALVNAVPDRGTVSVTEAVSPTFGGTTYAAWLRQHHLPADRTGLGAAVAEVAGDGVSNLTKYALGLDPRVHGHQGRVSTELSPAASCLELTYRRPYPRPAGITYLVEACGELTAWSTQGLEEVGSQVTDGIETVTVRDAGATTSNVSQRFMRLKVEEVAP